MSFPYGHAFCIFPQFSRLPTISRGAPSARTEQQRMLPQKQPAPSTGRWRKSLVCLIPLVSDAFSPVRRRERGAPPPSGGVPGAGWRAARGLEPQKFANGDSGGKAAHILNRIACVLSRLRRSGMPSTPLHGMTPAVKASLSSTLKQSIYRVSDENQPPRFQESCRPVPRHTGRLHVRILHHGNTARCRAYAGGQHPRCRALYLRICPWRMRGRAAHGADGPHAPPQEHPAGAMR